MKRIGILTFHRSINFGAFVQCYALANRIQKDFPDTFVEVIDYSTEFANKTYSANPFVAVFHRGIKSSFKSKLRAFASGIITNRFFDFYFKKQGFKKAYRFLPLSSFSITTDNEKQFFEQIKNKYDVIIAGSDCIWDFIVYPFPNAYFLNADLGAKKLAYAATTNRMKYEKLTDYQKKYIKESMRDFSYLGVRDHFCRELLKKLDPDLETHILLDPSLLLDMENLDVDLDSIKKRMEKHGIDFSKPVIGVMGCSVGITARKILGNEYQLVALYSDFKGSDYFLNGITPLEWAKVFSLFSLTISRFFHGMLLSLKNHVPVIAFDDWKANFPYMKSKIEDMLGNLDLLEYHFVYKTRFTAEEENDIRSKMLSFIENPNKEKIAQSIAKSEQGYLDFKSALTDALKD